MLTQDRTPRGMHSAFHNADAAAVGKGPLMPSVHALKISKGADWHAKPTERKQRRVITLMFGVAATPRWALARGLATWGANGRGSTIQDRAPRGWIVLVGAVLHGAQLSTGGVAACSSCVGWLRTACCGQCMNNISISTRPACRETTCTARAMTPSL